MKFNLKEVLNQEPEILEEHNDVKMYLEGLKLQGHNQLKVIEDFKKDQVKKKQARYDETPEEKAGMKEKDSFEEEYKDTNKSLSKEPEHMEVTTLNESLNEASELPPYDVSSVARNNLSGLLK